MDKQPLLSVEECATLLNVSTQTVRKLLRKQELAYVVFGKTIRISEDALNEFIKRKSRG